MSLFISEFIGTMLLIILGNGVVANVVLNKTKGNNSGWIVITFGWAMAVFLGVNASTALGGPGHLNPAVTIALTVLGESDPANLFTFITAQFTGAITGAIIAWLAYKQHFDETTDADAQLATFCNAPAIRNTGYNLLTEIIGTFVLVLGASLFSKHVSENGALDALPVALLIFAIGLSLGGPTGFALNPARDLGPRVVHFFLPLKNKRDSDWGYSWIPVVGPVIGALIAVFVLKNL
jgi:glycerol uptake facilitator protein